MKTKLTIVLLALAGGIILFANQIFAADSTTNSVSQTNEPSPFQIIVTPRKTRVHVMEPFQVSFEVKNITDTSQSFAQMSCSWDDQWKSDNSLVGINRWSCRANAPGTITLAPGGSFKEELNGKEMEMWVYHANPTNKISFRMGFTPMDLSKKSHGLWPMDLAGDKTYWSNEVTIDLIPN